MREDPSLKTLIIGAVCAIVGLILLSVVGIGGCKEFNRYQKRADAKNRTAVVKQEIKTAEQQARVTRAQIEATRARAEMRVAEAKGIREAQDLIAATLTPLYIQHEAIQAQLRSPSEKVYIPVGNQGVPLVHDPATE
jgi:hypothetical protein